MSLLHEFSLLSSITKLSNRLPRPEIVLGIHDFTSNSCVRVNLFEVVWIFNDLPKYISFKIFTYIRKKNKFFALKMKHKWGESVIFSVSNLDFNVRFARAGESYWFEKIIILRHHKNCFTRSTYLIPSLFESLKYISHIQLWIIDTVQAKRKRRRKPLFWTKGVLKYLWVIITIPLSSIIIDINHFKGARLLKPV